MHGVGRQGRRGAGTLQPVQADVGSAYRRLIEHSTNVCLRDPGPLPEIPAAVYARQLAKCDVTVRRGLVDSPFPTRYRHCGDVQFSG